MLRAQTSAFATLVCLALLGTSPHAAAIDPMLRFRVLPTEHFLIYYHQGEEPLARRLAAIAEEVWLAIRGPLGVRPPPLTHVILVDQTELANGWATPVPYNTVMITAAWPPGADFIGDTTDWLRVAFAHEFTHIVHLDRSQGWARFVRGVFGRTPVAFPNLFLPAWQIEGLATYQESVLTGTGRLHAGDFGAVVAEAARDGAIEPLDRTNGGLTDWPDGLAPYAYGVGFHQYLASRFGAATLATLAESTAGRLPFTASRAFRQVYGRSLGALWQDYRNALSTIGIDLVLNGEIFDPAIPLTSHGFIVTGPRFDRFTCATCPAAVLYSTRTPHQFPTLNRVTFDGSPPTRLTTRYLGSTTAIGRDTIFFDQQERRLLQRSLRP